MIYDQTCAAEKRRRRKRNEYPDPPSASSSTSWCAKAAATAACKSNCLSVEPLETEFGRKRTDQPVDLQQGFLLREGLLPELRHRRGRAAAASRKSAGRGTATISGAAATRRCRRSTGPSGILVTGIGGTGVITIGQILAMAAHLEGKGVSVLDMSGLAQKGGR